MPSKAEKHRRRFMELQKKYPNECICELREGPILDYDKPVRFVHVKNYNPLVPNAEGDFGVYLCQRCGKEYFDVPRIA